MGAENSTEAQQKRNNRTSSKKGNRYIEYHPAGGTDNEIIIHHKNGARSVNPTKVISYALHHVNNRHKYLVFGYMKQFKSIMNSFCPKQSITKVFGFMCFNQYATLTTLTHQNRQCFHSIRLLVLLYFHERETFIDDDNNKDRERVINDMNERDNTKECKVVEDLYDEIYDDLLAVVMAASRSPSPMPPVSPIRDPAIMSNSTSTRNKSLVTPKYNTRSDSNNHLISPRTKLMQKYEAQHSMKVDNDKGFALRNDEWWVSPEYSPEFPDPQQIEYQQS